MKKSLTDDSKDRAIFRNLWSKNPFLWNGRTFSKEIATKFLEDRGDTYQIDILA